MNTKKTKGCITLIIKQKWNRETKKKIEVKRKEKKEVVKVTLY